MSILQVSDITKAFGHKKVLEGVSFTVEKGEFVALLGENGAGKTTLIRILATLTRPTGGHAVIAGHDLKKDAIAIRSAIGVMSHATFMYNDLTAEENLRFYGKMYNIPDPGRQIASLLEQVNLSARRFDLVRTFSRGMQQRLALARAILHQPAILLLDEPFAGLDVNAAKLLSEMMRNYISKGITILLTTHDIDYVLAHAHRIIMIRNGHLIEDRATKTTNRHEIEGRLKQNG